MTPFTANNLFFLQETIGTITVAKGGARAIWENKEKLAK
jgi:hypothetical protein